LKASAKGKLTNASFIAALDVFSYGSWPERQSSAENRPQVWFSAQAHCFEGGRRGEE
jgi:hypothetical protein